MYSFDLPITETLLTPKTRKLSLFELFQAFPNGKDQTKEFSDSYQGKVFFSLDAESSPYDDGLEVVFVDPEIPEEYPQGVLAGPSSASLVARIRQDPLFTGGYADHSETLKDICPQLAGARYLLGSPGVKNSHLVFMVGEDFSEDVLISVAHHSVALKEEPPWDLMRSVDFSSVDPDDNLTLVLDLYKLAPRGEDPLLINMHRRSLVRNMLDHFPQKFEYWGRDNGVMYNEAWMFDWLGNELPPDSVREKPLTSTGEGGYVIKTWLHPENFICCACETDLYGEVQLIYQYRGYEVHGNKGFFENNELVRRRLEVIRRQVERKLSENHLRYSDNLDGFVAPHWDTCSYYKGVKMQL